jgi:hypothetical protein
MENVAHTNGGGTGDDDTLERLSPETKSGIRLVRDAARAVDEQANKAALAIQRSIARDEPLDEAVKAVREIMSQIGEALFILKIIDATDESAGAP